MATTATHEATAAPSPVSRPPAATAVTDEAGSVVMSVEGADATPDEGGGRAGAAAASVIAAASTAADDVAVLGGVWGDATYVRQFRGHRNNDTVKGVTFVGPGDSYIATGCDTGNLFIYHTATARIAFMALGDTRGAINCIAQHPDTTVPILVTSGLQWDAKVWEPTAAVPVATAEAIARVVSQNESDRDDAASVGGFFMSPMELLRMLVRRRLAGGGAEDDDDDTDDDDDADDEGGSDEDGKSGSGGGSSHHGDSDDGEGDGDGDGDGTDSNSDSDASEAAAAANGGGSAREAAVVVEGGAEASSPTEDDDTDSDDSGSEHSVTDVTAAFNAMIDRAMAGEGEVTEADLLALLDQHTGGGADSESSSDSEGEAGGRGSGGR